ncbi:hypothetical protein SprV_0802513400 [Sparganum proliferum]
MRPKDQLPATEQSAVVYSIPCQDCSARYVGETGKRLCTRLHEHQLAVNREDKLSLVYGHVQQEKHSFAFGEASVIGRASDKMARLVLESWSSVDTINRAIDLHPAYQALRTRLQINATYSVVISYHLLNQATARCEYVHTDRTVISDEMEIKEATPPAAPQIVALCAGPGAVIFGVSNPPVSPENEPTDKIVSQRVLFAPSSEFHSASNLASKSIILDVEGQPRSETVDANEEAVQDALENAPAQRKMSATDPPLVTVPITNLIPGTNYTFEWSSANQFSLTTTSQFTTSTAPLAPPLKPTHYIFLMPTSHHLRMAVFLDDPCPYENGGRAELGNILIRYRRAVRRRDEPNSPFTGYGNWTESQVCIKNRPKNSVDPLSAVEVAIGSDVSRILWSGDEAIQCELKVENTAVEYEVAVATTNRFGMSPWLPAIYRPEEAVRSAYLYRSRAFRKKAFSILSTFVLLPIFDLF